MPVDDQEDFAGLLVDVNHDVLDHGAQQLLTGSCRHSWRVPSGIEIFGQAAEIGPLRLRVGGLQTGKLSLADLHPLQSNSPTSTGLARRYSDVLRRSLTSAMSNARGSNEPPIHCLSSRC